MTTGSTSLLHDLGVAFLDGGEDEWQLELVDDPPHLVARAVDGRDTVLVDASCLDRTVTAADVVRTLARAADVRARREWHGRPAVFLLTRRDADLDAFTRAFDGDARVLTVHRRPDGGWHRRRTQLSEQTFVLRAGTPEPDRSTWQEIHDSSDDAVVVGPDGAVLVSFAALVAFTGQPPDTGRPSIREFPCPDGAVLRAPGVPPVPVSAIRLRYHIEEVAIDADTEAAAFAELVTDWMYG